MKTYSIKKIMLFLCLVLSISFAIGLRQGRTDDGSMKAFAQKFINAQNEAWKGNLTALDEVEDENIVMHFVGFPDMKGLEGDKYYIDICRKAMPDSINKWEYLVGDQNTFVLLYTGEGTAEKPGSPIPVGKKKFEKYLFIYRVQNGKIVEGWGHGTREVID